MKEKTADLAGPGIGTYEEVEQILPTSYEPILNPKETQIALFEVKKHIEENLAKELKKNNINLIPNELRERILNFIFHRTHVDALALEEKLGIPFHISPPKVSLEEVQNKDK